MNDLALRVEKLERQNCWFRWAGIVTVVACFATFTAGAQKQTTPTINDTVRAHEFLLVDAAGDLRGAFTLQKGEPLFMLLGKTSGKSIIQSIDGDDMTIALATAAKDGEVKTMASMSTQKTSAIVKVIAGDAMTTLASTESAAGCSVNNGSQRTVSMLSLEGKGDFVSYGKDGKRLWQSPAR